MPDPALYVQTLSVAAAAGAVFVLAAGGVWRAAGAKQTSAVGVLGLVVGMLAGCLMLGLHPRWPPASGMDRLLLIVLPAGILCELLTGLPRVSARWVWSVRFIVAALTGRILLHGSIYLSGSRGGWSLLHSAVVFAFGTALLVAVWGTMVWLLRRTAAITVPLSLAAASLSGGLAIMLAGYLRGGEASLALSGAIVGTALGLTVIATRENLPGLIGVSVIALFGLLWIGHFFGELTLEFALAVFTAPLLGCLTEFPALRKQHRWVIGAVRLLLVAIPLLAVLFLAKRTFDREMRPLLGANGMSGDTVKSGFGDYRTPGTHS